MRSLLIVEDSELVVRSLRRLLSRSYAVTAAFSCTEATELDAQFDLGIFDIDLPDGNGIMLAEQLLHTGKVKRAVFFSGSSDMDLWRRAQASGLFIKKSAGAPALLDALAADEPPRSTRSDEPFVIQEALG